MKKIVSINSIVEFINNNNRWKIRFVKLTGKLVEYRVCNKLQI